MKTKIFASIFLLLLTCCASLKEKQDSSPTTMDLLMKYKWKMSQYTTNTYTEKYIHTEIEINSDSSIEGKTLYYLSQKKRIRKFDKKQIGVHKNGKYMILNTVGFPAVKEILEINDTLLKIRNIKYKNIAKFKAMPK